MQERFGWLVDWLNALFMADEWSQRALSWLMLIALCLFPVWFVGVSIYAVIRRKWFWLHPAALIATSLHSGRLKPMPGTWGSLFAVYLLVALLFAPRSSSLDADAIPYILLGATVLASAVGTWASDVYAKRVQKDDPSEVVIDEVAGIGVAACVVAAGWAWLMAHHSVTFRPLVTLWWLYIIEIFVLFRIFDIWKPWIIGKLDRTLSGGWGIMADDLVAGVFAGVTYWLLFALCYYTGIFLWIFKLWHPDWVGAAPDTPLPEAP
jgi:phosphatidylglycerophosphatase A